MSTGGGGGYLPLEKFRDLLEMQLKYSGSKTEIHMLSMKLTDQELRFNSEKISL